MSTGGSAIRGSRVGAGPMGEQDRGFKAERITVSYYCSAGHEYSPQYAANVEAAEIPELLDCPSCGLPAGQDKANPPVIAKHEPYKTHLAYVKERRTAAEAKELLEEAVAAVRERRIRLAEEAKVAAKEAAKAATKKASAAAKAVAKPVEKAAVVKDVKNAPAKPVAKSSKSDVKPVAKSSAKPATKSSAKTTSKVAAKPAKNKKK
jgi:RNA polymerase-binding protein